MKQFVLVYDRKNLPEIIKFLGDGFDMGADKRKQFRTLAKKNPADLPFAAINEDGGVIQQAILLIYQPSGLNSEAEFCFNLSCWYAIKEQRGIEAILFMKNILKLCSSYTFTDYTPSKEASAVLKVLGFTNMNVVKHQFGFTPNLKFVFPLSRLRSYFLHTHGRSLIDVYSLNVANSIGDQKPIFYWITINKKRFISARILNVFIDGAAGVKRPSFFDIVSLMFKFRAISFNIFLSSTELIGEDFYGPWLVKSPSMNKCVVPPIASELTVLSIS